MQQIERFLSSIYAVQKGSRSSPVGSGRPEAQLVTQIRVES
jgi:hypothetical protein